MFFIPLRWRTLLTEKVHLSSGQGDATSEQDIGSGEKCVLLDHTLIN